MAGPPKRLKINEVPSYVDRKHGEEITRQTAYNWIRNGVRGVRLQAIRKAGKLYTTERWVDDFMDNLGR